MIISLLFIFKISIFKINVCNYQDSCFTYECDKKYYYITVTYAFVEVLIFIYQYNLVSLYVSAH